MHRPIVRHLSLIVDQKSYFYRQPFTVFFRFWHLVSFTSSGNYYTFCTEGKALCQYWDYIEESNAILMDIHSMRKGNILNKKMIVIVLFLKKFRLFFESLYIKIIDFSFYMLLLFKSLLALWGRPSELFRNKRIENVHPLQQYPILENIAIGNILQLDFIRSTFSWFKTIRLINGC